MEAPASDWQSAGVSNSAGVSSRKIQRQEGSMNKPEDLTCILLQIV